MSTGIRQWLTPRRRGVSASLAAAATALVVLLALVLTPGTASATTSPINLATAAPFSVLGGSAVTNTGPSVLLGGLGVSPGTSITGFPPGNAVGAVHDNDAVAAQAQADLTIAYNDAASRPTSQSETGLDLGGQTLPDGVYTSTTSSQLTGTLTLDGQGNPDAVFIFQVGSTLTTASASTVALINGAQACHVFWQIGSSATLGTNSTFVGTIMALASISVTTGTVIDGRALARTGAVTLDSNVISSPNCAPPVTTTTTAPTTTTTTTTTTTSSKSTTTSPPAPSTSP